MTEHPLRYRGIDIPDHLDVRNSNGFSGESMASLCNFLAGVDAVRDQEEALRADWAALAAEDDGDEACVQEATYLSPADFARRERYTPAECGPAQPLLTSEQRENLNYHPGKDTRAAP